MADNRQLTPSEIEAIRAYGKALLQPQEPATHGLGALGAMLRAIGGYSALNQAGTAEYYNTLSRGASALPPIGSRRLSTGSINRMPETSSYPPTVSDAIPVAPRAPMPAQPRTRAAPIAQNIPSSRPAPSSASSGPEITPQEAGGLPASDVPSELSPDVERMFQPNARDRMALTRISKVLGTDFIAPVQKILIDKFGATTVADALENWDSPILPILNRNRAIGEGLAEPFPAELVDKDLSKVTAGEWYGAWARDHTARGLSGIPSEAEGNPMNAPTDGMMRLGAPPEITNLPNTTPNDLGGQVSPDPGLTPESTGRIFTRPAQPGLPSNRLPVGRQPRYRVAQGEGGASGIASPDMHEEISGSPSSPPSWVAPYLPANTRRIQSLEYQLSNAGIYSPDEVNKLQQEYAQLTAPREVDTGFGKASYEYNPDTMRYEFSTFSAQPQMLNTPSGSVPSIPTAPSNLEIPNIGGNNLSGMQGRGNIGGRTTDMRTPEHPLGPFFGSMEQHAQDLEATRKLSDKATEALNDAMDAASQAYEIQSTLDLLRTETERAGPFSEGGIFRGPGSDWVMRAKQLLSNFGVSIKGLESLSQQEQINKIITQLGSVATRQLSNRPANFEFQTILKAFPGIETSYEGANLLIDYLQQVQERAIEIGTMAESLPIEQRGRWRRILREYYDNNPIVVNLPASETLKRLYGITTPIKITTKRISPGEEKTLPADTYFIRGGELHRGDGGAP